MTVAPAVGNLPIQSLAGPLCVIKTLPDLSWAS